MENAIKSAELPLNMMFDIYLSSLKMKFLGLPLDTPVHSLRKLLMTFACM